MCGRYTLRRVELVFSEFDAVPAPGFEEFTERPLFNIAPSQRLPVVRINSQGDRVLDVMGWGLVPAWTKGKPKLRPINARCETAAGSAMFRTALEARRCLVPADGFYEWHGEKPRRR